MSRDWDNPRPSHTPPPADWVASKGGVKNTGEVIGTLAGYVVKGLCLGFGIGLAFAVVGIIAN